MKVKRIEHVGIVVRDVEASLSSGKAASASSWAAPKKTLRGG